MSIRRDQIDLLREPLQYTSEYMSYADMNDLVSKGYADAIATTLIRRNYEVPGSEVTGSQTLFRIPFPVIVETAEVYIDGLLQDPADYTWLSNNSLQFNSAPNSTQVVEVYHQQFCTIGRDSGGLDTRSVSVVEEDTTLSLEAVRSSLIIVRTDVAARIITLPIISDFSYRSPTVIISSLGLNITTIRAQGGTVAGLTELILSNRSSVKLQASPTTSDWFKLTGDRASATT